MPRHVVQAYGAAWTELGRIVTNGPFRLLAWERGVSLVLERYPAYHGRFPGNLGRVELTFHAGEPGKLLYMYEKDGLDVFRLNSLPPAELDRTRQRYAAEYVSGPSLGYMRIGFDVSRPPFDDPRVRRAFALATDRETLANVTLRGYVFPATGGWVPPEMPGHSPGIGLPYDPERARQLLAEAGYPDGCDFPVLDALRPPSTGRAPAIASLRVQWRENLGVEVAWKTVEYAELWNRLSGERPQMWWLGGGAEYPDPDDLLGGSHLKVFTGWQNKAYDELVERARRVMDQAERMRLYGQAERILVEEAPHLPLAYLRYHFLIKPWVLRYPTSPVGTWFWKDVVIEPH